MARDVRDMPRGLIAPLSQLQLALLRSIADGYVLALPDEHRARLLHLELVRPTESGLVVTELGRERLVSDR
ncbi:hypothetical protein SAMN02745126_02602 [Enhydrobacter aerosaccus]|uniref:Uncharacterized protein n=1 Tax=Enhydrobacter aerosaccus TaxID=225324 RepID=A0A1T4P4G6_9HYPH|nr:hypothetical protein [Enhydrobacter aerosaccus]SJZ86217.1 hypothetical protein SAMN02745126_02602 [Enhydrobacter aerosaccus]